MAYRNLGDDPEWMERQKGETREEFIIRTTKMSKELNNIDVSDIARKNLAGNEEALKRLAEALGE